MAKQEQVKEEEKKEPEEIKLPDEKKSPFNIKILLFGLPIFIVQLIVVYFITANILLSKSPDHQEGESKESEVAGEEKAPDFKLADMGKYIFLIEDIIVNPAGTDGKRLLLTSVGFDLTKEESKTELKNKEVIVKDIIISTLSSKMLSQLDNLEYKDSLKVEISSKIREYIPDIEIKNVYFSKYIIQ